MIRIARGSAWSETWALADDDGVRQDLTGCTVAFEVYAASGTEPQVTGSATLSDAEEGEITPSLTAEQVAELDAIRVGHWLLTVTDAGGIVHRARGPVWMEDEP
jgi:hypothetical protein